MPSCDYDYRSLLPYCETEPQRRTLHAVIRCGTQAAAGEDLGISTRNVCQMIARIRKQAVFRGWSPNDKPPSTPPFQAEELPVTTPTIDELLERRRKAFERKRAAKDARKLISVTVNVEGPYGICFFGDPHLDDDGCDIPAIERHIDIVNSNPHLFAGNVGDTTNNWVGRLARLYAEQSSTAAEGWVLAEWFFRAMDWLFILGGNHDVWSGSGDPLKWMQRNSWGVQEDHGCRIALRSPDGREIRVNARHDFHGHSMWNAAHGPMKAAQMGWRDHILVCGHKHVTGQGILKCPATGLISHAIRVATFKTVDRYADELNLPDGNVSPSCTVIIDPSEPDNSPGCVTVIHDVGKASDYLCWLREKRAA